MTTDHILAVQSRKTGRFLLEERDGVWNFAVILPFDSTKGMLYELLADANRTMGHSYDWDDYSIDYVDKFPNGTVFHALVDNEDLDPASQARWFSLFDFPENFDPLSDTLFDDRSFIERIVSPSH